MLLDGVNHVAVLTRDTDRLHAFYREVFDATVSHDAVVGPGMRLSMVDVGPHTELNVFELDGNTEADRQTPMFERGRIDHMGLHAASLEASRARCAWKIPTGCRGSSTRPGHRRPVTTGNCRFPA